MPVFSSYLFKASENITKWFSKWATRDLWHILLTQLIEKNPCRMTFKSYCIITDKKKVKQFTVTMKCLYSYIVESLYILNSERQHAVKIAVSALHARVIF